MPRFEAELVQGAEPPYDTWTFVHVPDAIFEALGGARPAVRGTIEGIAFRETITRSKGVPRLLVRRELLERVGKSLGDVVVVRLELDRESRDVEVPAELRALFVEDPPLAKSYAALPPSMRRAWAVFVGEAKRAETRARRAEKARSGIRERLYPNQ